MTESDYLYELEQKYKEEQKKRDFGKEILETMTYPEAKDMLAQQIEIQVNVKKLLDKKYKKLIRLVKKQYAPGTFEFDFTTDAVWILTNMQEDIKIQKLLDDLEKYWYFNESRNPQYTLKRDKNLQPNISVLREEAKQIPIEKLYKNQIKQSGQNRLIGLCPFRKEKTPSFFIFTNTNTFCCFGCDLKGDVITFYQKLYNVGFIEAVTALTEY